MNRKPKLVIKENFDEDDISDDVDDEVFVRDGKNTVKMEKQKADEQPLMAARRKHKPKQNSSSPEVCNRQPCNIYNCLLPVYFGIAAIISIAFLMLLYIFLVDKLPLLVNKLEWWPATNFHSNTTTSPCSDFKVNRIWAQKIPKLKSDSQIKLIDIDRDGVDDIVIGTGTEFEDALNSERICAHDYDKNDMPCLGGVIALNGKTGSMLWKLWLTQMVLAIHCDYEITGDSVPDCVVTGREGLLLAINGADGSVVWERKSPSQYQYELYNVLITRDLNQDGYMDILASHYSRSNNLDVQSSILVINGRSDKTLHQLTIPSYEPILHAPQIITDIDGSENIIFVTGDPNRPGGLYIISMHDLLQDPNTKIKNLYHFDSGICAAPILVDVNLDGTDDIVFAASTTVFAVDGNKYTTIWNTSLYDHIPNIYQITVTSSVTPTYFDDDNIPDLLLTFSVGSIYPEYYYSVILILNGKNGRCLLNKPIIRSGVADTVGAIALSFNGYGNDAFIYWMASCKNYPDSAAPFSFMPNEDRQSHADLCGLRFNSTSQLELYALNQHVEPPGVLLKSESWYESWDYNIRENVDVTNEQATLLYTINTQKRPKTYHRQQMPPVETGSMMGMSDEKQYSYANEKIWPNSWKSNKVEYENNGAPVQVPNDNLQVQPQLNDYGPENDIPVGGRNEKEYDVPMSATGRRYRRNLIQTANTPNSENKMLPKVSASGVLTKSLEATNPGVDLVLIHYEIKIDNDVCIVINKEQKCLNQNRLAPDAAPKMKHYGVPVVEKIQERMMENNLLYNTNPKYNEKTASISQNSNLYISRYRLTCDCMYLRPEHEAKCSKILPYEKQAYPAYLGRLGNSAFKKRDNVS